MEKSQEQGPVGNNITNRKENYETPKLTIHGTIETITKGNDVGDTLDASFTVSNVRGKIWQRKGEYS